MIWRITPLGEAALLAEADGDGYGAASGAALAGGDHGAANRAALAAAAALEAEAPPWLSAAVPAIASLLVCFDPLAAARGTVEARVRAALAAAVGLAAPAGRIVEVPVAYGAEHGPDLAEAALALGLTPAELVALHCAEPYRVMMIGFAPGYPYIGPLPPALRLPRRSTPRAAVPAGSVAIAAGLTGIYPARLPGGWHLIGRTDLRLFDHAADPPALLAPGDRVQFIAVPPYA